MKFNLTKVTPDGMVHHHAFDEVRDSLGWSLCSLGHDCTITENWFSENQQTNIIFGTELMAPFQRIPQNSVIFNLEQSSHPNFAQIRQHAKGLPVWDFSLRQVSEWKKDGYTATHLPIGYTPNLSRIPSSDQDIDVLFLGWMTQRRVELIAALRSADLNVVASAGCYGGGRDNLISRAKVMLNVHHDGRDMFEIVRCSYYMANAKCVVTESSSDQVEYSDLDRGLSIVPYRLLVDTCTSLCCDNGYNQRRRLSSNANYIIKQRDFTVAVADAISQLPAPRPAISRPLQRAIERKAEKSAYLEAGRKMSLDIAEKTAIENRLGMNGAVAKRYEQARISGDMAPFAEYLCSIAKGNILEIGVRDGASTSAFLTGLEKNGGHLTSIDIADCGHLFSGHPLWTFVQMDSRDMARPIENYDVILIDGDHSADGYSRDLEKSWDLVNPGGLILSHDIVTNPGQTLEDQPGSDLPSQAIRQIYFNWCATHNCIHSEMETWPGLGVMTR